MKKHFILIVLSLFFVSFSLFAQESNYRDATKKHLAKIKLGNESVKGHIVELKDSSIIITSKKNSLKEVLITDIKTIQLRHRGEFNVRIDNLYAFSLPFFVGGIIYGIYTFEDTGTYINLKPLTVFLFANAMSYLGVVVGVIYNTIAYTVNPYSVKIEIQYSQKEYKDAMFILKQYLP